MTYIIAEIGVNHDGSFKRAKQLIDMAKQAGADAAKFQIFITEDIVSAQAPKAEYQIKNKSKGKTQYEMLKALELSFAEFRELKKYCAKRNIDFLASVFGLRELDFYVDELGCRTVKFGSGELTNAPLILAAARKDVKMILSTGMAELKDIEFALGVIAYGYTAAKTSTPTDKLFKQAFKSAKCQAALKNKVIIMQCTTQYPCPDEAINLRAMQTIAKRFKLPVGFSDHSVGIGLACASVALGAVVIEKHFTYDRETQGPDHRASLDFEQFKQYIEEIRSVEKGLGDGRKIVNAAARKNADISCKKIVAAVAIPKDKEFTEKNLATRRVGSRGIRDRNYFNLVGKKSSIAYNAGDAIVS